MAGIKHLIECHCYLAIFSKNKNQINHKFPVYSRLDEFENIVPKLVLCNNCEALHYVFDVNKSELRPGKDQSRSVLTIDELSNMIPDKILSSLQSNDADISSYDHAIDIIENRIWGDPIVLKREVINGELHVKIMKILSKDRVKISNEKIENVTEINYE